MEATNSEVSLQDVKDAIQSTDGKRQPNSRDPDDDDDDTTLSSKNVITLKYNDVLANINVTCITTNHHIKLSNTFLEYLAS